MRRSAWLPGPPNSPSHTNRTWSESSFAPPRPDSLLSLADQLLSHIWRPLPLSRHPRRRVKIFWFSSASHSRPTPSSSSTFSPPPVAFGLLWEAQRIADIFQSRALPSLQSQCHCSSHVVESSFDRAPWWITWLRLLEKKPSDPIALLFS